MSGGGGVHERFTLLELKDITRGRPGGPGVHCEEELLSEIIMRYLNAAKRQKYTYLELQKLVPLLEQQCRAVTI